MNYLNKYARWYFQIVRNAQERKNVSGYSEKHHIVPVCVGGCNCASNKVKLTPREHFICHLLLVKMASGLVEYKKLLHAAILMKGNNAFQNRVINNRLYAYLRQQYSLLRSEALRGKPKTLEFKRQVSKALLGHSNITPEGRKAISLKAKARPRRPFTEQERLNIGAGMRKARALREAFTA